MLKSKACPLPVKNGVSPNCLYLPNGDWNTIYDHLLERFPHLHPHQLASRFKANEVVSVSGEILSAKSMYKSNQHIYFYRELEYEMLVPFKEKIIYEDEHILVVDKPHFLPVAPTGNYLHETLLVRLRRKLNDDLIELCHRLDRETAGVVLLTKRPEYRRQYHSLFSEKRIKKTYHALTTKRELDFPLVRKSRLVKGEPFFRMVETSGKSNSETIIEFLENRGETILIKLTPTSGKKHQLRVHLAALKMPIVNDVFYPELKVKKASDFSSPLKLLAKSLEFIDPVTKAHRYFESDFSL